MSNRVLESGHVYATIWGFVIVGGSVISQGDTSFHCFQTAPRQVVSP